MAEDTITIGKKVYCVERVELPQASLKFYPENPRVYSALRNTTSEEPTQEVIEACMIQMEHVKKLKLSIESNGGLIDPLIVRKGDNVVLEGNSRLAAYRILNKNNPIKWGKVKCLLLPSDIDDTAVFTLLGQYHIVGRKDWSPFEQAGYLYRRIQTTKYPIEQMASELGISSSDAKHFVEVYNFMVENDAVLPKMWSYFEEYLKNKSIRDARQTDPTLDKVIVEQVMDGTIQEARDMRKLGEIFSVQTEESKKAIEEIKAGALSIPDAHAGLSDFKQLTDILKRLSIFRKFITPNDFEANILNADKEQREKILFELQKINKRVDHIAKKIEKTL